MAVLTALAIGSVVASGVGAAVAAGKAKKDANSAKGRRKRAEAKMESIKDSRQDIVNPYAGVTDLSSMAQDLSSNLNNPFAQLSVLLKQLKYK